MKLYCLNNYNLLIDTPALKKNIAGGYLVYKSFKNPKHNVQKVWEQVKSVTLLELRSS